MSPFDKEDRNMDMTPIEALSDWIQAHPPRLGFRAQSGDEFISWKRRLRDKLEDLSGLKRMQSMRCALDPAEEEPVNCGDHTRQRILLTTAPGYTMPLYLLKPVNQEPPFRPLIALHGHGRGKSDVAGVAPDEKSAERIRRLNYDYGMQAVRQGYMVFAPDKRGFGERGGEMNDCLTLSTASILQGFSVIGLHTWDNQRLIDYIHTRPDVIPPALSVIGLSGGGGGTLWLSAMDDRVAVAVVSGHLSPYENGRFGCICNVVPHLLEWAERSDLAGLIAPRPLLIESASRDQCYSRERTLRSYAALGTIYRVAGVPDHLDIDLFEGGHEWSGRRAWRWLERWLTEVEKPGVRGL